MRKGFLIYEEMRKYFPISEEAVTHTDIWLCIVQLLHSEFLYIWGKFDFLFLSVHSVSWLISCLVSVWEGCCLAHLSPHRISHFQMLSTTWHFNLRPSLREENKEKQGSAMPGLATFGTWKQQCHTVVHLCKDVCSKANLTFRKIRFCNFYLFHASMNVTFLRLGHSIFFIKNSDMNGPCR